MSPVPIAIRNAYDPERFRANGHRLIDALADQLGAWHSRDGVVLPWIDPEQAREAWAAKGVQQDSGELVDDLMSITRASTALGNPRCMGHQVPPPLPGAALAEMVSALLNNGMAVAEMGPASVPIELAVIEWMAGRLGLNHTAGGVLTSGGSVGNLTALLVMRQRMAGYDAWSAGAHAGPPLAVIVSSDAHYSIARTLHIMGWGDGGAIPAKIGETHQLTAKAVEDALATAGKRRVIGIVAAAGSTAVGAFDPLHDLADVADKHGLWLHVDAAHGGGAALSKTERTKLDGIARADSVVWDAHKLLMMPALVTAVLFKNGDHSYEAFAQRASYLFADGDPSSDPRSDAKRMWWDLGTRTLECTKRAMAIEVWTALRVHGEEVFRLIVDRQVYLARSLAEKVTAAPDFELALAPQSNIVCYRYTGTAGDLDAFNRALRQKVVEDGRFYIVGTQLPRGYFLRSTLMNPLTEPSDLDALLVHLRALAST
ncbi:MAG: pyridoxal phosphate-dependent decarboxylase family protein [Kofleriaceae bacterium]